MLSLYEYSMRMKAYSLAQVDKERDMHLQAWLNHEVTSMKEQGNKYVPVYREFRQFYDYKKRLKEAGRPSKSNLTPQMRKMAQIAAQVNKEGG